jgi:endonuclease/exonuclease/phosphatase family metal-dependent hydrolase
MRKKPLAAASGNRFRSLAAATLSLLTIGAVAYLAIAPISGNSGNVLLQAQEKPVPALDRPVPLAPATTLRIATWNVRDCAATDPSTKERLSFHEQIAITIRDARADIVVLEEVQSDEGKGGDIALLSVALAREGWAMPYVAVVNARGEDDLALFSRLKITEYRSVLDPSQGDPWPRPGIFASIDAGETMLDIYGFHFKAMGDATSEKARLAQAEAIGQYLVATYGLSLSSRAIILAGDFNTANASDLQEKASTLSALRLAGDGDATNDFLDVNYIYRPNEPTFVDSRYSSILDHILISATLAHGIGKDKVEVLKPSPGHENIPTSDHNMVLVEISMPRED